jgi:hypothetical protein
VINCDVELNLKTLFLRIFKFAAGSLADKLYYFGLRRGVML